MVSAQFCGWKARRGLDCFPWDTSLRMLAQFVHAALQFGNHFGGFFRPEFTENKFS